MWLNPFTSSPRKERHGNGPKTNGRPSKNSKWLITLTPILIQPDQDTQFRLETDASSYATGVVLSQLCKDNKWHPVGFMSKSLSSAERNYKIHDKELLSVIRGLEEWRHHSGRN